MTNESCAAQHYGHWAVKLSWLKHTTDAYNAGTLPKVEGYYAGPGVAVRAGDDEVPLYTKTPDGIGWVGLRGAMTKGRSSFGGTSNVMTRRAFQVMEGDPDVKGIMVQIDSPGGTVAGQYELSEQIAKAKKPVHAYVDGSMHSAALWAGVQADRVTAGPMAEIGSIGVVAVVHDSSEMAAKEGVKVHVVSTGDHKGSFTPGAEVTDEQIDKLQERVDEINGFFLDAVKKGRGLSASKVAAMATGEDWMASKAVELGLIDGVGTEEQAVAELVKVIKANEKELAARQRVANQKLRMAGL